jgi:hypothetical protein
MKYKSCGSYCKISRINLEETWKKQRQKEVNNKKEIRERLMTKTNTEAWNLLDKKANYILQKTIRMQMEAWTLLYIVEDNKDGDRSMDSVRRRERIICTLT